MSKIDKKLYHGKEYIINLLYNSEDINCVKEIEIIYCRGQL